MNIINLKNIPSKHKVIITAGLAVLSLSIVALIYCANYAFNAKNKSIITSSNLLDSDISLDQINIDFVETDEQLLEHTDDEHEDLSEEEMDKLLETQNLASNTNAITSSSAKYYIKVNYGAQVATVYSKDDDGKYTIPVKAMICSTGTATPTSGVYTTTNVKYAWHTLFGNVYGQYTTQIVGNILFHSVPYSEKYNHGSLISSYYDKLGSYASAGCVRLTVADSKWIYNNCSAGTFVEFYTSSNPGPLGKPSATKVSSAEGDLKNWDPTDSNSSNPWLTYTPTVEKEEETTTPTPDPSPEETVPEETPPETTLEATPEETPESTPESKPDDTTSPPDLEEDQDSNTDMTPDNDTTTDTDSDSNQESVETTDT